MLLLMLLNLSDSTSLISQSLCWIVSAKFFDQSSCVTCDVSGELNCVNSFKDNVVGSHRILAGKWWCALNIKINILNSIARLFQYFLQKITYQLTIQTLELPNSNNQHWCRVLDLISPGKHWNKFVKMAEWKRVTHLPLEQRTLEFHRKSMSSFHSGVSLQSQNLPASHNHWHLATNSRA